MQEVCQKFSIGFYVYVFKVFFIIFDLLI